MAMPWEMDWNDPEREKPAIEAKPTGGMPWERDWSNAGAEQPAEASRERELGMLLPVSWNADDGSDYSFDSDAGLLGAVKRAVMLPGQAMSGEIDPTSEEGIGRAFEFATVFSPARTAFPKAKIASETVPVQPRSGFNPVKTAIIGEADDAAKIAQRAQDFRDIGVQPTTGMVSGSTRAGLKEHALANTSREIQGRIDDAFEAQGTEFGRIVDDLVSRNNPGAKTNSRQELGEMLRTQAQAAKDAAFARSESLYDDVGRLTGENAVSGTATKDFLKSLGETKKAMGKSESLNRGPQINKAIEQTKAITADIDKGMSFTKLKEARTAISRIANDRDVDPALKSYLDDLRKALTTDMEATAGAAGDDALQAFRKANNHYRRTVDGETGFGKGSAPSTLLNKNTPEEIYGYVMGKSKEGGSRLNMIRRQIEKTPDGKATWDNLTGSVVERMGLKTADDTASFDPGQFMRNWKTMSPEAKDVLFKGTDSSTYRQDLDRLARVADSWTKYREHANHSNSTNHRTVLSQLNPFDKTSLLAAAFAGPKGFAAAAGAKAVNAASRGYQSRMLSDPQTVNWLAGIPKAQVEKGGLRRYVGKLIDIAEKTPNAATRTAVFEYLRAAGYDEENSAPS